MAALIQQLMRNQVVMVGVRTCVPIKFHELLTVHMQLVLQQHQLLVGEKLKPAALAWN
jgi:hypothetical protein